MTNRWEKIKEKGFNMRVYNEVPDFKDENETKNPFQFANIRVGVRTLEDAILSLGSYKKNATPQTDKESVLRAIHNGDITEMRDISSFFYRVSGIYNRLCRYMAFLYRYDWFITPYMNNNNKVNKNDLLNKFYSALNYFDESDIKKVFGEIALKVLINGCYYGYYIDQKDRFVIQELEPKYCRTRYIVNNKAAVEFNMKYFDDNFRDVSQKERILKMFPKDFQTGYKLYKQGKLKADYMGDTNGWYLLDPSFALKFNLNGFDFPPFISIIPKLIDLDEAQDLDKKKTAQELLKIIIQKMPIDKNGDPVFDIDEARDLHNNAVAMLSKAIGLDVLTTYADTEVANMADTRSEAANDTLERVERSIYNEAGVSQMQFNTDGNIALEKSILNDEASMYNLVCQFEKFLNDIIRQFSPNAKKFKFRTQILTTTIYNYKDMAKLYKEQTQLGYSKILPQLALGQSQSSILANAVFENDILDLVNVFVPPMSSNTMNAEAIQQRKSGNVSNSDNKGGRPEKPDDEKTEKTIQNKESTN